jgi:hypothetical protein
MQIKVMIFIMLASVSINAMEKPQKMEQVTGQPSSLDALPPELQMQILEYISGNTLDEAVKGIKRFYIASPESRKDPFINKIILQYLMRKFIFEKGSDLQKVINNLNKFPVFKEPEMIQWIEQEKKRLDSENELRIAAGKGDAEKVRMLINKGINKEARDKYGATSLLHAIQNHKNNAALILIEHGANVNASDKYGSSVLVYATNVGNLDIVKALLKKKANPNLQVNPTGTSVYKGETPLMAIGEWWQSHSSFSIIKEIIEELLKAGADPNIINSVDNGKTAADYIRGNSRLSDEQKTELLSLIEKYSKKNQP